MRKSGTDSARDLIAELKTMGVVAWRDGDNIHCHGRNDLLTPEVLARIKARKAEILPLLGTAADCASGDAYPPANIVLLESGSGDQRVFCVHAIDGGVGAYAQLARELAARGISTYGIFAIDLREKKNVPASIKSIAAQYVEQVRRIQKQGPYALAGWSSGGVIAFEMACQLCRDGEEICELTILDADLSPPDPPQTIHLPAGHQNIRLSPSQDISARVWWRFLNLFSAALDESGHYPISPEFWTMDDAGKSKYLLDNRGNYGIVTRDNMFHSARNADDILYMFQTVNIQHEALERYEPSSYPGPVNLFITLHSDSPSKVEAFAQMRHAKRRWKSVTTGVAHVECFPDGHLAIIRHPYVCNIARCIFEPRTMRRRRPQPGRSRR